MKKQHILLTAASAIALSLSTVFVSLAGQWQTSSAGWWYQEDDGSYPVNAWKELNGKWYYFNQDGYMAANTTTPDGYKVGPDGAWIQNEDPMAGIECSSKWLMYSYVIEDMGDQYKITGDIYDYDVAWDFSNYVGSDGLFEQEYPELYNSLDNGFRKSNVTIYVDKKIQVSFYPWSALNSSDTDYFNQLRAKNLNELLSSDPYPRSIAFDLDGDVVTGIYDVVTNYVS